MKKFISKLLFLLLFLSIYSFSTAQIINSYASITGVAGTNITISAVAAEVDETAGLFMVGDRVIIMQMQDNVIGTTADAAGFGDVGTIAAAGLYEVSTITARTGTSITLATLANTFNTGANSSLQLISFPTFCTRGATTGLPWDGNIGGVIAFRCAGTMTLNGTIDGNEIGFRGGAVSDAALGTGGCGTTPFISNSNTHGEKGESIYRISDNNYRYALGKIINGGGGGIDHNGGGGGGGNFTAGGQGGNGWNGSAAGCTPSAGGYGGELLSTYINLNRAFMGGGGGGAEQNNNFGTSGVRGGGIVIIEANQIITSCPGPVSITVNGATSLNTTGGGNDSAGGAGAGGSIIFRVNNFTLAATCPITATANGGNGGTANFDTTHGGGGGGGQGVVIFANGCPNNIQNINVNTNNGSGGCNVATPPNPCPSSAGSGSGVNGTGIICDALLPIEWLSLDAEYKNNQSIIDWKTTINKELDYFIVERSSNGKDWKKIGKVMTSQTIASSYSTLDYQFIDKEWVAQLTYYRINQFDKNGSSQYSPVVSVNPKRTGELTIYPNPAKDKLYISYLNQNRPIQITIISSIGKLISVNQIENTNNEVELNIAHLSAGIYLISIQLENGEIINHKFIVEK